MSAQKCEGESFFFRGRELTEPGVYYDTIPSVKTGCDSIIKLILSNYPTYHFEEVAELEEGKSYEFYLANIKENESKIKTININKSPQFIKL